MSISVVYILFKPSISISIYTRLYISYSLSFKHLTLPCDIFSLCISVYIRSPPDFYWDRPGLERLFTDMCDKNLDIPARMDTINEQLTYSNELADILRNYISQRHSSNLEQIIILLICVEVIFETLHWLDRLYNLFGTHEDNAQSPEDERHLNVPAAAH